MFLKFARIIRTSYKITKLINNYQTGQNHVLKIESRPQNIFVEGSSLDSIPLTTLKAYSTKLVFLCLHGGLIFFLDLYLLIEYCGTVDGSGKVALFITFEFD